GLFDDRGGGDAEEVRHHAELGRRVHLPEGFGPLVVEAEAVQHPLGAEDVNAVVLDDGAAARAAVVVELIDVGGGGLELPEEVAGRGVEAGEAGAVLVAVELEEAAAADRRHAVADADLLLPDQAKPLLGPGGDDALLARDAGAERAEEDGPVIAGLARAQVGG